MSHSKNKISAGPEQDCQGLLTEKHSKWRQAGQVHPSQEQRGASESHHKRRRRGGTKHLIFRRFSEVVRYTFQVVTPAEPTENVDNTGGASTLVEGKAKKKGLLGSKVETVPPYDVVPSMRPVVIIGPSLKVHFFGLIPDRSYFVGIISVQ